MARLDDTTGRDALLKASRLKAGRVLDLGMGGCACMAFFLAHKGFDVTGVDRSPHAVRVARQNARTKRFKGTFVPRRADASHLPFHAGVFDAAVSFHSLHHMDEPKAAIREMFRVCRPGATVLIAELNATGRKLYGHEADHDGLLETVERVARSLSSGVQITHTRLDRFFICRIKTEGTANRTRRWAWGDRRIRNANGQVVCGASADRRRGAGEVPQ